ncbi:FGGY-family carbohydrate kinase [Streptomyces endophyticus]|uniref:FGGY family carbohydrate kinase n=1 Tax=Streptomyces endophyticus TaxID=714166 RepID=A0ABU6FC19_9ACTN|nr:FGGY family carbohydrate kinase [Streptomyces endophyticus]MEB8341493.1 FGGY family carbohydrate kinase [Streptomyces endophyticus]
MSAEMLLGGLDIGTTHVKAVLCDTDGRVVGRSASPTPYGSSPHTHPADALVAAALGALAQCVREAGRAPQAIGVTGMAEAGVPLDAQGCAIGPVRAWSDPAPAPHAARLADALGAHQLHARTGVLPSPKVPLAKWCALVAEDTGLPARMRTWAGAADLVAHALTGAVGTDATFAQRTMAWDPVGRRWIPELLGEAGLGVDHMPRVCGVGEPVGHVTAEAAGEVGLRAGTPVVVAGHDHLVGAWAAGVREPGHVADSMGTAEAVLTVTGDPPDRARAAAEGMSWGRHADGTHFIVLAGTAGSGLLVEWFCDRFLDGAQGRARYEEFARLVATLPATPCGPTVTPYVHGRSAPRPDPRARLAVHDLRIEHGPAHIARAILEGTAHQARWMTDTQAGLCGGAAPGSVTLLGGSTRLTAWTALKAAVCPWPTRVCAEPEAPGVGAALLAGTSIGLDGPAPAAPSHPLVPDAATAEAHRVHHRERFLLLAAAPTPRGSALGLAAPTPRGPAPDPAAQSPQGLDLPTRRRG